MRGTNRIVIALAATLVTLALLAWHGANTANAVTPTAAPQTPMGGTAAAPPGGARPNPVGVDQPGGGAQNPEIRDLDQQIQSLKSEFHSQLDPLEQQVKSLRDKYDPEIKSLEDRRHDLVEAGKSAAMQEIDRQEAAEIASLNDSEKSEIEKVKQHYADERKDVRAKYQNLRARLAHKP